MTACYTSYGMCPPLVHHERQPSIDMFKTRGDDTDFVWMSAYPRTDNVPLQVGIILPFCYLAPKCIVCVPFFGKSFNVELKTKL